VVPKQVRMIILDDASNESDRIRSIVESYPNTTYLFSKTQIGPAGGRNRGLREATTPFCLSIDDDCYLDATPDLSPWLGDRLEDRDIAIVGFRYYNVHEGVFAPTSNDAGPAKAYLGGANLMRRDAVLKAGGYLDTGSGTIRPSSSTTIILKKVAIRVWDPFFTSETQWQSIPCITGVCSGYQLGWGRPCAAGFLRPMFPGGHQSGF
jgi:glycosyltransferase involved in cell wall biosynthesis